MDRASGLRVNIGKDKAVAGTSLQPGSAPRPPVKLLFTTPESYPTWRSDVRLLFGKFMNQAGGHVDLVTLSEAESPTGWPSGKIISIQGAEGGGIGRLLKSTRLQLSLFKHCFGGYDALIVRDFPILSIVGYVAAKIAGVPFIYWMSFPIPEALIKQSREREDLSRKNKAWKWMRGTLGVNMLYRWILPRCAWVFVQSDVMIAEVKRKGVRHDRFTAVPMGVDIEALAPRPIKPPTYLQNRRVGVYLGTLDRYRNPEIMIDIALHVAKTIPDFTLLVIGDADEPTDRGWLKAQAELRGASGNMHFTGRLSFDEAQSLLQLAEVGLSPFPRGELLESASPTKAIEYLAACVPVVCNDQPDQEKVIRESGGGWCVELTAKAFGDAIIESLRDPERSRQMAIRGNRYVRDHRNYRQLANLVADRLRKVAAQRATAKVRG